MKKLKSDETERPGNLLRIVMSDGGALFGIAASTPTYLTAVFDADGTVWRWFPELVWTFLRGGEICPLPGTDP